MQKTKQSPTLIFIGIDSQDSDTIHQQLKQHRLAFNNVTINDKEELKKALDDCCPELVLFAENKDTSLRSVCELLKSSSKDIPVIAILKEAKTQQMASLYQNPQISNIISMAATELIAPVLMRELKHLENRRRRRQTEFYLKDTEQRCRQLLMSSNDAIGFMNRECQFIFINDAFLHALGLKQSQKLLGQSLSSLVEETHHQNLKELLDRSLENNGSSAEADLPFIKADKSAAPVHLTVKQERFERVSCLEVTISPSNGQVAPVKTNDEDALTGLKNHLFLHKVLDQQIQQGQSIPQSHLLYILPDHINNLRAEGGPDLLDAIIQHTAKQLKGMINRSHLLVRYQHNALCVLFNDGDTGKAKMLAEQIHTAISTEATTLKGESHRITASIGVVPVSSESDNSDMVISMAMNAAAEVENGNGVNVYGLQAEAEDTVSTEELKEAIAKGQLKLLFQPVVSLCAEQQKFYEVLLRLLDENNHQISPNEFMNMLNKDDISIELDRWVINESIEELARHNKNGDGNRLFINLTGNSLDDPQLATWIAQRLSKAGIKGESLIFQISEQDASARLTNTNKFSVSLGKLKAQTCIKHYGSSIDSDLVLEQINADFIKLDGSFVKELNTPDKHEAFDKLIEPIKNRNKTIIAPLVEGTTVISKLWKSGIPYIQGYYLQAPREHMDYDFFHDK